VRGSARILPSYILHLVQNAPNECLHVGLFSSCPLDREPTVAKRGARGGLWNLPVLSTASWLRFLSSRRLLRKMALLADRTSRISPRSSPLPIISSWTTSPSSASPSVHVHSASHCLAADPSPPPRACLGSVNHPPAVEDGERRRHVHRGGSLLFPRGGLLQLSKADRPLRHFFAPLSTIHPSIYLFSLRHRRAKGDGRLGQPPPGQLPSRDS
jgi:hypothetical protein